MPRRCTNCANVRRQQQYNNYPSCQETGTDPNISRLCWLADAGRHCGRSVCKMMRGVTWCLGTFLCCITAWMVYSELSGCVTSFFWNIIYTFLAIAVCATILVVLSGRDISGGDQIRKPIADTAVIISAAGSNSKRSGYGIQGTSTGGVSQVDSFGGTSDVSKLTADGRTAGGGESGKRGDGSDDAEIRVTELSSNNDIEECDPCPGAEED